MTEEGKLEKVLSLVDAQSLARDRSKIENFTYVIWWVMDKGYVVLPEGTRPNWFFATVEQVIHRPGD